MTLRLDDVEKPDGSHTEHEVVRGPDAAGLVVVDDERGILMIWRHRFMPDTWGWEVPGGAVDQGESFEETARREFEEESGWSAVGPVELLSRHHPSVGLVHQTFEIYLARGAQYRSAPTDANEAVEVEWRPLAEVAADLRTGAISDGFSQLAVGLALGATGHGHLLVR